MANMQVGPGDIPSFCMVCRHMTLHRPGVDRQLHCLTCLMRPPMQQQVQQTQVPPVIQVQQKAGGGVVRSTIDAAKFVLALLFLLSIGTCVYVCGSATHAVSSATSKP